jgi:K+-sensing histidine kinase KdpD
LGSTRNSERDLQVQRDSFIVTLGHDLKNPIVAQIKGLELFLQGCLGEINKEQRELLEMLLNSCKYMNGMLSSLLATYRNYDGIVKLNFEEFSFIELVNECVSEMIYVAKDKGINISLNNDFISANSFADRILIKRVVMNLLSNGIKYAFRNTDLELYVYTKEDKICFKFINQSPYIPLEKQKCLFEQYVSFAPAHKEYGVGLGLYASKKIVEAHNGEVYFESFENNRNSFGFRIPIIQKDNLSNKLIQF